MLRDKMNISSIYSRVPIIIADIEFEARPVVFKMIDGVPVDIELYETVCPDCGSMIQFAPDNKKYGDIFIVQCGACKRPSKEHVVENIGKVIEQTSNVSIQQEFKLASRELSSPFIDPIEIGIFSVDEIDFDAGKKS
jgi:hypothetical protein